MEDIWLIKRKAEDRHFVIRHLITADDEYGGNLHTTVVVETLPEYTTHKGLTPTRVWFHEPSPLGDYYAKAIAMTYFELLLSLGVGHILSETVWQDSGPNILKKEAVSQFDIDQTDQGEFS